MPWERHDNSIYGKVVHWFEVIKEELCRPDILLENIYNMDEAGIMLSMLGAVKILVGKDDGRDYRGTRMTKKNMLAGWAKTGLFPFNPLRVLRDIVEPDAPPTVQVSHDVGSTQNGVIQTPVTPVTLEAKTQLLSLTKQDSHNNGPNEMHRHRLIQKLADAAETSIA